MIIIEIAGHLGADPEVRFTPGGQKVTTLRIATNTRRGGKDETVWWRVTVWGERFDKMMPYLKKGSAIIVVGEMSKPEIYTDKEGRSQVSLELTAEMIRFNPFGKSEKSNQENQFNQNTSQQQPYSSYGENQQSSSYTAQASYTSQAAGGFGNGPFSGSQQTSFRPAASAPDDEQIPF